MNLYLTLQATYCPWKESPKNKESREGSLLLHIVHWCGALAFEDEHLDTTVSNSSPGHSWTFENSAYGASIPQALPCEAAIFSKGMDLCSVVKAPSGGWKPNLIQALHWLQSVLYPSGPHMVSGCIQSSPSTVVCAINPGWSAMHK